MFVLRDSLAVRLRLIIVFVTQEFLSVMSMAASVIKPIVEQHAEEAAFLWLLRDAAVFEPHYSLKDLAHLDGRVEAHIDGLRIAGDVGWEICKAALALEEPGEIFVAAVLAFESEDGARLDEVIHVAMKSPAMWRALVSATGWLSDDDYQRWIPTLREANAKEYFRLAIDAATIRRDDSGETLKRALDDDDLLFQARALRAVGELKRRDLLPLLRQRFVSDDDACRFWAAWSAVLLGDQSALDVIKPFVSVGSMYRTRALQLALRLMDNASTQLWLKELATTPALLRDVLTGTGIVGDPLYIPTLIKHMDTPEVARIAGEAFTLITGVDLAYDDLDGDWPEGFEAGPTEDPADECVDMDADEDLPWPESSLVQKWWDENQQRFQLGQRYLMGEPINKAQCEHVLKNGMQRQRYAAALELALIQSEMPLFETRAPGISQKNSLGV